MQGRPLTRSVRGAVVGSLVLALTATLSVSHARSHAVVDTQTIALAELPKNGQITHALIFKGGPFAFDKDGTVFGNFERILPRMQRGYYREYTVRTPGRSGRGAKRIVCGGWTPASPDACYYTHDHYASFRKIVEKTNGQAQ
ncbi:ribonuclease N [Comamonas serinivorans]|uniref:Ribonuclease N n=1 Tax=Comamonas serinivorans TaxID=1082851 RepID=A0A1Y0EJ71_9BURK|nr:ribonuclease N [Comamonas serinivorans]